MKNNNPFNIRLTKDRWQGQIASTNSFVRFRSVDYGIRAGINLLRTYIIRSYDTPKKIIYRFAPPVENNTRSYLRYVCEVVGVSPDTKISLSSDEFFKLCKAICWFESHYKLDRDIYDSICYRFRIK